MKNNIIYELLRWVKHYGIFLTIIAVFKRLERNLMPKYYKIKITESAESIGPDFTVRGKSYVNKKTTLGRNVNFNGMMIRGEGSVTIGDNFHSGEGCEILTSNHNYDRGEKIPYDETYTNKCVTIKNNVWIGSRVIILPGVTIGEGAIIQAGSTVTHDIPMGSIAGGHPAEVFDNRDMKHYNKLKSKNEFY